MEAEGSQGAVDLLEECCCLALREEEVFQRMRVRGAEWLVMQSAECLVLMVEVSLIWCFHQAMVAGHRFFPRGLVLGESEAQAE